MFSKNTAIFISRVLKICHFFTLLLADVSTLMCRRRSESRVMSMLCVIKFPLSRNWEGVKPSTRRARAHTHGKQNKRGAFLDSQALATSIIFQAESAVSFFFHLSFTFDILQSNYSHTFMRLRAWNSSILGSLCVYGCVHLLLFVALSNWIKKKSNCYNFRGIFRSINNGRKEKQQIQEISI